MKIKMTLLSDAIFGNGISVPGEEDISVQLDDFGFPYYRGSTFKGIFREELTRYLKLTGMADPESYVSKLLGESGSDEAENRLVFSDFVLSPGVKKAAIEEIVAKNPVEIKEAVTNVRTFTALNDEGMVEKGSLRMARCINKGLVFYSSIDGVKKDDEDTIKNTLGMIKWIGTLRNRGFGKVKIEEA